jgi:transposase-like protein
VLNSAKGLQAAIREVYSKTVEVQRCQWYKRENVLSYLPKADQLT